MNNSADLKPSRSPLRLFLFILFALVILVLLAEGGYYFWLQKRVEKQQSQEEVFTYYTDPSDDSIQKMIDGTIEKIEGNLLTIKTNNNKTAQVLFTGEYILIVDDDPESDAEEEGTIEDLLVGDKVRVADIYFDNRGEIKANFLIIYRDIS